jgi:hypothetical protein
LEIFSIYLSNACNHFDIRKDPTEKDQVEAAALEGHDVHNHRVNRIYYPIRFKYDLYELALAKLVSVFERRGNRYLQEGVIPEHYNEQLANLDVRSAIQWFLENGGVHAGQTNYSFSHHLMLLELIDYIVSLIESKRIKDNWREIQISEAEALRIIELYDRFNESFINEWFKFDTKPMFTFRPQVTVSSGEQSYLDLFSTLYYHAGNIEAGIDIDEYNGDSWKTLKMISCCFWTRATMPFIHSGKRNMLNICGRCCLQSFLISRYRLSSHRMIR